MNEEEKKSIDFLKNDVIYWLDKGKDFVVIDIGYNEKLHCILNLIEKQQKEIDFYKKEELGYIAGYEDGKRHKQTAVAIRNENAQQEIFQKEIARLKEIIEKQQKEIEELKEDLSKKVKALDIAMSNPDYICKDKISELEKQVKLINNQIKELKGSDVE